MQRLTHPTPPLSQHVSTCSPATSQLVEKMLVIDPKQRIRTYDELLIRIDGILAEATIHLGEQDVHPSGIDSTSVLTGFLDRTAIANADSPTQHFSSAQTNSQAPITISTGLNRRVGDPSADATVALSTSSLESLPTESVPGQTQSPRAKRIAGPKWLAGSVSAHSVIVRRLEVPRIASVGPDRAARRQRRDTATALMGTH
ncbi:MAG: hypothetical protein R3C56_39030 [Pirellulaceae bacterium]